MWETIQHWLELHPNLALFCIFGGLAVLWILLKIFSTPKPPEATSDEQDWDKHDPNATDGRWHW